MQFAMGPTRERDGLPYGNAVLTRLAIRSSRTFDLSRPDREPRGGIRLDLEMPARTGANGLLHVFNVHFGLKIRERAEQVRMLVREHILHDELTGPRIVVGDLNEWFPGAVGRTLRRELAAPASAARIPAAAALPAGPHLLGSWPGLRRLPRAPQPPGPRRLGSPAGGRAPAPDLGPGPAGITSARGSSFASRRILAGRAALCIPGIGETCVVRK